MADEPSKQIGMGAGTKKEKFQFAVVNAVDQKPVRFNMTFTKTRVITDQLMIAVFGRQSFARRQSIYRVTQKIHIQSALFGQLEVFLSLLCFAKFHIVSMILRDDASKKRPSLRTGA